MKIKLMNIFTQNFISLFLSYILIISSIEYFLFGTLNTIQFKLYITGTSSLLLSIYLLSLIILKIEKLEKTKIGVSNDK